MLTVEQKKQFSEILDELGKTLDISEAQYDAAVKSYNAVGDWLSKKDSALAIFKLIIAPQGSFLLGTMIKPINEADDLDIDLVCELTGKRPEWTQADVKNIIGDCLKENENYKKMLDKEGRRCWTLIYSESANYHMDILPSIVSNDFRIILEKTFSIDGGDDLDKISIRITDKKELNYNSETNIERWLKCNPFGYGKWFLDRGIIFNDRTFSLSESIKSVPKYQKQKLPLQRVVQILKRHRDMMFNGDEDKPISIIITTLAAKAYKKDTDVFEALNNICNNMISFIEEKYSEKHQRIIKWVSNPVNEQENFADKWAENTKKQDNFYAWVLQVQKDISVITQQNGLSRIQESFEKPFGKAVAYKTFSNYGENMRLLRESGALKMASNSGLLGSIGTTVKNHNFYGKENK
jgi:Second Messenger Oligonucleotide or Dinucleotide Synthetase domain